MSNYVDSVLDSLKPVFEKVDECLTEWKGDGNLQMPTLISMVALKLSWSEKDIKKYDPMVRFYVRDHKDWYITRGAHGGIMPITEKQKKDAAKLAKELAKQQVKQALDAKLAAQPSSTEDSEDTDESDSTDD